MGTTLTGLTPATTYDALIKVTDNGPLSGSLKTLTDGLGNDSALALSTGGASITGTLAVSGNATFDTSTLVVDAANNRVGVGTATPSYGLDTRGIAAVFNAGLDGITQPTLYLGHPSYTTTYLNKISTSVSAAAGSQVMQFSVGNGASTYADVMTLNGLGNVGIGTSSPLTRLHVGGSGESTTLAGAITFGDGNSGSSRNWTIANGISASGISQIGALTFSISNALNGNPLSAGVEVARFDTSGNVGIGTTSPAGNLHIASAADTGIRIQAGASSLSYIDLADTASGTPAGSIAYNHIVDAMTFATGGSNTERMRITSAGNVGIGTSSPSQKLQVAGTGVTRITVENTDNQSTGAGLQMLVKNGGSTVGDGTIRTDNADNMQFFNIAGKIMELTSTGNLSLTTGNIALSGAGGIYFDSGASKYLDDYEVGSWTPAVTFGGNSVGLTYTVQSGKYVKVGSKVSVTCYVVLSNKGTSVGVARVTGLPFTIPNSSGNYGAISFFCDGNISYTGTMQGFGNINSTTIVMAQIIEAGTVSDLTDANFANNSAFMISFTYLVS